jgi:hypothetical protein
MSLPTSMADCSEVLEHSSRHLGCYAATKMTG